jgi:hypothetical protein
MSQKVEKPLNVMTVLKIRNLRDLLSFLFSLSVLFTLFLVLPTLFCWVFWNAIIYEGMNGPAIDWYQGGVLWLIVLSLINLIFRPEIRFQLTEKPNNLK